MLYSQDKVNLHTHSYYCGHGVGEISDYVQEAKTEGYSVLGFSEHCPVPDNRWPSTRMQYNQLTSYIGDVLAARNEEDKPGATGLQILLGAECDYLPQYHSYFEDKLLGEYGFNYLIGAVHFHRDALGFYIYPDKIPNYTPFLSEYVDNYVKTIESGLFLFCAHPDLYAYNTPWSADLKAAAKDIIQCAAEHNMPLEVNGNGLRKKEANIGGKMRRHYTIPEFWEMALDAGVHICCNSDAHKPQELPISNCLEFAKQLGIEFVNWKIETLTDGKQKISWE